MESPLRRTVTRPISRPPPKRPTLRKVYNSTNPFNIIRRKQSKQVEQKKAENKAKKNAEKQAEQNKRNESFKNFQRSRQAQLKARLDRLSIGIAPGWTPYYLPRTTFGETLSVAYHNVANQTTSLRPDAPEGWGVELDPITQKLYYVRSKGIVQWEKPTRTVRELEEAEEGIPKGWHADYNNNSKKYYYVRSKGIVQWEKPNMSANTLKEAEEGLQNGWHADYNNATGQFYYVKGTETQWEKPTGAVRSKGGSTRKPTRRRRRSTQKRR